MDGARAVTATFVQQTFALTVTVQGSGTVTSTPAGIDCPGDCSQSYPSGTQVTLAATAATGWTFGGWSGACTVSPCVVSMDGARAVTATFTQSPPQTFALTVTVQGSGTVTSTPAGISCPGDCSQSYPS